MSTEIQKSCDRCRRIQPIEELNEKPENWYRVEDGNGSYDLCGTPCLLAFAEGKIGKIIRPDKLSDVIAQHIAAVTIRSSSKREAWTRLGISERTFYRHQAQELRPYRKILKSP